MKQCKQTEYNPTKKNLTFKNQMQENWKCQHDVLFSSASQAIVDTLLSQAGYYKVMSSQAKKLKIATL